MSPGRRPARPSSDRPARRTPSPRGRTRRGSGTLVRVALVLVALGAVAAGGLALYMGVIPGMGSVRAAQELDRAADSALAESSVADTVVAPPPDSSPARDSLPPGVDVVTLADSAAGDLVYRVTGRCVACHGAAAEGVPGLGTSLQDTTAWAGDASLASIRRVVTGGAPASSRFRIAMPAYGGQLTTEDIARVAAFVYAVAHPGRTVADSAAARPDSAGAVNATAGAGAPRP